MIINSYDSANLLIIKQENQFELNYLIVKKNAYKYLGNNFIILS